MSNTFSPFDYPKIRELSIQLFEKIFNESERGAIIIATSHVEDHLTKYIESVLPEHTAKYKKRLFQYPGPLSSFSAKIELSYAFGLINSNIFNRLNNLRKIRNEASHSSSGFSLNELKDQIKEVYNIDPFVPEHIRKQSIELMMKIKLDSVNSIFDEHNLSLFERKKIFSQIIENDNTMDNLEKQLPHWELLYGTCLLCGIISYQKDKYKGKIPGIDLKE